jgi:hypothetical protein
MNELVTLYRPMGLFETRLVLESNCKEFPPRLEGQPIFYPVLNEGYAVQIASEWNTTDEKSGYSGFVASFNLNNSYFKEFEVQHVGDDQHNELWVPADKLQEFNSHIMNGIIISKTFYGDKYQGIVPDQCALKGKTAKYQIKVLSDMYKYNLMDFHGEITALWPVIFLNYQYWIKNKFVDSGLGEELKREVLNEIEKKFKTSLPHMRLPIE